METRLAFLLIACFFQKITHALVPGQHQRSIKSILEQAISFDFATSKPCERRGWCLNISSYALLGTGILTAGAPFPINAAETSSDLKEQEELLWKKINTRRPSSYNPNETREIETLIDSITSSAKGMIWDRNLLQGTWRVAYIRSGENGGGLDRRIPFPELPFNESYQKFTLDSVTNIGELLGPNVRVEVKGGLKEEDIDINSTPKRFRAKITGGDLCAGDVCVKLPIEGVGLFDGVYLGERIRIGQNLNGSGALVVQVRT